MFGQDLSVDIGLPVAFILLFDCAIVLFEVSSTRGLTAANPYGGSLLLLEVSSHGLTAAVPMENLYCGCSHGLTAASPYMESLAAAVTLTRCCSSRPSWPSSTLRCRRTARALPFLLHLASAFSTCFNTDGEGASGE